MEYQINQYEYMYVINIVIFLTILIFHYKSNEKP